MSPLVVDPVSLGLSTAISEASCVHCCPGSLSAIVVPVRPVFENRWCDPGKRLFSVVGVACLTLSLLPFRLVMKRSRM